MEQGHMTCKPRGLGTLSIFHTSGQAGPSLSDIVKDVQATQPFGGLGALLMKPKDPNPEASSLEEERLRPWASSPSPFTSTWMASVPH